MEIKNNFKSFSMTYYYIFYMSGDFNFYERTCGSEKAADSRVNKLKTFYDDAIYFKDNIPKDFKYFY